MEPLEPPLDPPLLFDYVLIIPVSNPLVKLVNERLHNVPFSEKVRHHIQGACGI